VTETSDGPENQPAADNTALEPEPADVAFSLQGLVDRIDWSAHIGALGKWKQTDVITGIPLTWVVPAGTDPVTALEAGFDDADLGPVWFEDTFDAVICSQTCDLGGGPPGNNHPTVLVAPLIHEDHLGSNKRRNDAAKGMLGHLVRTLPAGTATRALVLGAAEEDQRSGVAKDLGIEPDQLTEEQIADLPPLTLEDIPRGHRWYADLRLLMPISKGLLVTREPRAGVFNEDESLAFGEILAQKFRRPALHEALSEDLPKALEEYVRNAGANRQPFAKVDQVRLHLLEGDRLAPVRGRLVVLTENSELDADEQAVWLDLNRSAAQVFQMHDITYAPLVHFDVTKMPAALYRNTVPVRCRYIGHTRWP
jgi:hypothetical protein